MASSPTSIDSLPNELLSMIFQKAVITFTAGGSLPSIVTPRSEVSDIASLSQVSKRWSGVSLGTKLLWASALNIDSDCLSKTQDLARRANTVPLVIYSDNTAITQSFRTDTWRYAFEHIDAWGAFSLQASVFSDKSPLVAALTRAAPQLESFKLHIAYYRRPDGRDDLEPEFFKLPKKLFSGNVPRLREFSTLDVYFPVSFDFSVWKQLRVLCVHQDVKGAEDDQLFARKWLEILDGTPQLESLLLGWNWTGSAKQLPVFQSNSRDGPTPDVYLNRLRKLDFSACSEANNIALNIFSKLIVSDACHTLIVVTEGRALSFRTLEAGLYRHVKRWVAARARLETKTWHTPQEMEFGFEITPASIRGAKFRFRCIGFAADVPLNSVPVPLACITCPFGQMLAALERTMSASFL